jgi:hypothetical protein
MAGMVQKVKNNLEQLERQIAGISASLANHCDCYAKERPTAVIDAYHDEMEG